MTQESCNQIFQAIKQDNLVDFSSLIKGNKTLSFGRFPLLSLCFLYNAKKIIKNFKYELLKIKNYTFCEEPIQIYKDFRKVCGKCLRFYTHEDAIVSPLEMLAILHKDFAVKKLFIKCNKSPQIVENLKKIYTLFGQNVEIKENKIVIGRAKLSYRQKRPYKIALILATSCFTFISLCFGLFSFTTGLGTSFSPFVVQTQSQLFQALNTNRNFKMSCDIVLNDFLTDTTFSGVLDGNNHTIYVKDTSSNHLVLKNCGIIKNLNIVYVETTRQISSSFSLLSNENLGTIQNVNINCQNLTLNCNKSQNNDIYVNAFANSNSGTIKDCSLFLNSQILASGNGECYVSGFVGDNKGKVENCIFKNDSSISTQEADLCGIATNNSNGAVVKNCKNYANLTQTSALNGWSPNVSGIVQTNYGEINSCYNLSELIVTSTNNEETAEGNVLLGGICALNYGAIEKCLNKGNLKVDSQKIVVYCGGVTAHSSYWVNNQEITTSSVNNCGVDCQIDIKTNHEKGYAFVGGISGYLYGESKNCYSVATFTTGYDSTKYFVGSYIGSAYVDVTLFGSYIRVTIANDYVLSQSNISYQIASLINGNQIIVGLDSPNEEIKSLSSIEQIKQQEVYFDE